MSELVLMTGASGFLGRRLLRAWLAGTDARVVACVRPRHGRSPAERLALAVNGHDPERRRAYRERVTVLAADLAAPGLGLDAATADELAASITHIVHCGGVVRFDLPLAAARRTNTAGTAAVLALARRCVRLRRLDHISTAFVAGDREGLVLESELDQGQEHHNSYERSKFEAELLVRAAAAELPVAVHRPSIITCDRRGGELSPHGAVARLMLAYAAGALTGLPGRLAARLDLVPADVVADAVLALASRDATIGGCFHLAAGPARATPLTAVRDLAAAHFQRPPLILDAAVDAADPQAPPVLLRDELSLYAPYLAGGPDFDVTATTRALAGTGIAVPPLEQYFAELAHGVARLAAGGEKARPGAGASPQRGRPTA
jgi:thioester reductase-like protein